MQAKMTVGKTWKYEYIRDKTAADLLECIGANDEETKNSYEDLFMALEFDENGTECKMEGIEGKFKKKNNHRIFIIISKHELGSRVDT